jgi:hypothetical protein
MERAKAFDEWFNGQEGFALRSERCYDDIRTPSIDIVTRWMRAAFDAGATAALEETKSTTKGEVA